MRYFRITLFLTLLVWYSPMQAHYSDARVAFDNHHGKVWSSAVSTLNDHFISTRILDGVITPASLQHISVLIIYDANLPYSYSEIVTIKQFVQQGGGLLCADQAWSWVYPEYGNKPIETFPLNQIGRAFGFWITGKNVGLPKYRSGLFYDYSPIHRKRWWPSKLTIKTNTTNTIRDKDHNLIAIQYPYGLGQIMVFGHGGFLSENPMLTIKSIREMAIHHTHIH